MILSLLAAAALAATPSPKPPKVLVLLAPGEIAPQVVMAPPPAADSADTRAEIADLHRIAATVSPARLTQARWDDEHEDPSLFAPTLGPAWDLAKLPATRALLALVQQDADTLASASKKLFPSPRPWAVDSTLRTCDPGDKPLTSYPSGHATLGYALAETLAHVMPNRAEALLTRADDYAFSREVCAAHFSRDTAASHALASALVAALMAKPEFRKLLEPARAELATQF